MLDVECLTLGSKYTYSVQFKLLDGADDYKPYLCDKNAAFGTENSCPYFTLAITIPDQAEKKYLVFKNIDQSDWIANEFNHFQAEFEVTDELFSATEAKMILNGPRPGIAILFDEASLELKVEGDCENLVPNGNFEVRPM